MAVVEAKADAGIILTASHNPKQWNALKLLNHKGEFISAKEGEALLEISERGDFDFAAIDDIGHTTIREDFLSSHIQHIIDLPLVDVEAIQKAGLKVAIDGINSSGGFAIPALLEKLGVKQIEKVHCDPTGQFAHNPEPLKEHVVDLCELVKNKKADIGFVVDPDVDRLAIVSEDGEMFGEEYTLVAVADYILEHTPGSTVSNLSSSRALRDITEKHHQSYFASAVGEVNVVEKMKSEKAIIGGEGNGGIIYPELHYGRDALVGIALFLTYMVKKNKRVSEIKAAFPTYYMEKRKIELPENKDVDKLLDEVRQAHQHENITTIDGVKIDFDNEWVHLRKSNTEPIIRVYAESTTKENVNQLADRFVQEIVSKI
ncbi:MAG: phosphoglucosamine mutase [Bacteroidetes bacterium]|nr:MAG: phosphoglucosamine mutase [Bacteroidota bacterium]